MSDPIKHECGLVVLRLRKPLSHYRKTYGDAAWGLRRLYLLMEKQHNRGQDGAGIATVKFDMPAGDQYLLSERSAKRNPVERLFDTVMGDLHRISSRELDELDDIALKRRVAFLGEVHLGHLRYGTHGGQSKQMCHPYVRRSNSASRNLAVAGNFNMTNSSELFRQLVESGLNPVGDSDTLVVLERIGYCLDREHEHLRYAMGPESFLQLEGRELAEQISRDVDFATVLERAGEEWDGGYVIAGLVGNGDAFVCRDPSGIRPAFYYVDDDVVAVASERVALSTAFDVAPETIPAIRPGHVLIMKRSGSIEEKQFRRPAPLKQCTFERIYFSRGNDPDIYRERKALGANVAKRVLDAIDHDVEHAVFSFIPNTAETAYFGLVDEIDRIIRAEAADSIWSATQAGSITRDQLERLIERRVRREKAASKDQRLRTFITHDRARRDLVSHVYDVTRGTVGPDDTLVVVDDSIVRGTTLRESIITMLSRLEPRQIVVVSSAPPIMYPDCYGIDMSQLGRFIAFEAAISLLRESCQSRLLDEVEERCRDQADLPPHRMVNHVRAIYDRFTMEQIENKIADLVRSKYLQWPGAIRVIYQTIDGLRAAMPEHTGDWYFTGEYPTPGGYAVLNRAYLKWRADDDGRAY